MYSQQACSSRQIQHRAHQGALPGASSHTESQWSTPGALPRVPVTEPSATDAIVMPPPATSGPLQSQHRHHPMSPWPMTARAGYRHRYVTCDVMTGKTWSQRCFVFWKVKCSQKVMKTTVFTEENFNRKCQSHVWLWFCPSGMFTQRLRQPLVLQRECEPQASSTTCAFASIGVACSERVACQEISIATKTSMFEVFFYIIMERSCCPCLSVAAVVILHRYGYAAQGSDLCRNQCYSPLIRQTVRSSWYCLRTSSVDRIQVDGVVDWQGQLKSYRVKQAYLDWTPAASTATPTTPTRSKYPMDLTAFTLDLSAFKRHMHVTRALGPSQVCVGVARVAFHVLNLVFAECVRCSFDSACFFFLI